MRILAALLLCVPLLGQDAREQKDRFLLHLDSIVERTQKLRDCLPREEFDLDALAAGKDAAALAAWVRDRIAFEPYRGFMKGAQGTLLSRSGNSADRALLLATLLSRIGVPAKLVSGSLEEEKRPRPGLPPAPADRESVEPLLARCASIGDVPDSILKDLLKAARTRQDRFLQRLWTRADRDWKTVQDALAGVKAPEALEGEASDEYWWVRTDKGDIDPGSDETGAYDPEKLPSESFHKLAVRMKIRKNDDEATVLDVTYRTADLYGQILVIGNAPIDAYPKLLGLKNPTKEQILDVMASASQFQPQVSTPARVVAGHPFDLSGNKLQINKGRIEAVQDMGKGLGGLFGGGGGEKKESNTRLTKNWLELELSAPGDGGETIARTLFEQGVSDRQRAFDLLATREILILPGALSEFLVTDQNLEILVRFKPFIAAQVQSLGEGLNIESYRKRPHTNETLLAFALGRQRELRRLRDARFKDVVYVHPRPTLVSYVRRFIDPSRVISGIDILHNDLLPLGQKGGWEKCFALAAGILDTALEHEINRAPGDHANTSVLFERAMLEGRTPSVEKGDETIKVSVPGAHYRIRASTGSCLGYVGEGGQDLAEYAENVSVVLQLRQVLLFYADFFKCIAMGIAVPLSGNRMDVAACAWDLVCSATLDVATSGVDVATNWTNIIIQQTIGALWGGVSEAGSEGICQKLRKQLGIGR